MKIKLWIKGLLMATLLLSCVEPNDYFEENNLPPVISVRKPGSSIYLIALTDSMKASNGIATYFVKVGDENPTLAKIDFQSNFNTSQFFWVNDSLIEYRSTQTGQHNIIVNVTDVYGIVGSARINLTSYDLAPSVYVKKKGATLYKKVISDSMKSSNGIVTYSVKMEDETPNTLVKEFRSNFNSSEFNPLNDSIFEYHSNLPGEHQITVSVTDAYGAVATARINLISFENIPPIAMLSYTINGNEITLDASKSYDGDEKFGGGSGIVKYEFSFDGNWMPNPSNKSKIVQGFDPKPGIVIKVRVYDQENAWDEKELTIGG